MSQRTVDAMDHEWTTNLRALRALWVLAGDAMRKSDESFERLNVLAAELAEWREHNTIGGAATVAKKAYESALRAFLEAP